MVIAALSDPRRTVAFEGEGRGVEVEYGRTPTLSGVVEGWTVMGAIKRIGGTGGGTVLIDGAVTKDGGAGSDFRVEVLAVMESPL